MPKTKLNEQEWGKPYTSEHNCEINQQRWDGKNKELIPIIFQDSILTTVHQ